MLAIFMFTTVSCSKPINTDIYLSYEEDPNDTTKYSVKNAFWYAYENTEELMGRANMVFIAKITNISWKVMDYTTWTEPNENTEEMYRSFYTFYAVDIIKTYRGDTSNVNSFIIDGGIKGYRTDEQLKAMEDGRARDYELGIRVHDHLEKYEIGKIYLFALFKNEPDSGYPDSPPHILNLYQSVYKLDDPLRKQTIRETVVPYYEGDRDPAGSPMISPKDIISYFGQEKWTEFYNEWNKPDSVYKSTSTNVQ